MEDRIAPLPCGIVQVFAPSQPNDWKMSSIPYLWHMCDITAVKQEAIRTTVDIPTSLYRRLKEQAAAQGRSVRELILAGARSSLLEGKRRRPKRVHFPLIVSKGPKVDLTNEHIYEYVEFP